MKEIESDNEKDYIPTTEGSIMTLSNISRSSSVTLSPASKLKNPIKTKTETLSKGRDPKISK